MCPERGRKIIDELVNTCIIPQAQNPIYACYCPQFLVLLIPSPLLLTTRRQVRGLALAAHRRARPPLSGLCASLSSPLPRSWWPPLPEVPIFSAPSPCCCSHAGPRPGRCLRQPALRTAQGSADGAPAEVPTALPKMQAVRESESGDGWPACSRSEAGQRYRYDHSLLFF